MYRWEKQSGFTIVELLIVIVVIGILAAITIVAFNGVQDRARASSVASDLTSAAKQLKIDQTINESYPATIAAANEGRGLKASPGTTYSYSVNNNTTPQTFSLTANNGPVFYMITQDTSAKANLAKGASSPNALLTDGVVATNPYHSMSPGLQSVTVTLPNVYDISAVKVWHYYGDSRTYYATKTEVSEDGAAWTTVFDSATEGTYQENLTSGKTHIFPSRKVRYIRDWLNGSTSNTGNHWVEIQAY